MGWSFRRSLKLGPLKINLSKSGVGYSIGGRGFRVGKDAKGRSYTSASIPGTGLYNRTYSAAPKPAAPPALSAGATGAQPTSGRGFGLFLLFAAGVLVGIIIMGIFSASSPPAPVTSPPATVTAPVAPPPPVQKRQGKHRAKNQGASPSANRLSGPEKNTQ